MVGVIECGVVHHGGNHQVDVDPQGVVEHETEESQESEEISDRNTVQTGWTLHIHFTVMLTMCRLEK